MKTKLSIILASLAMAFSVGAGVAATSKEVSSADGADVDYSTCQTYYNAKEKVNLFSAVRSVAQLNRKSLSGSSAYDDLWDVYKTAYLRSDGKIFDYYSSASNFRPGTDQAGNYSKEGDVYNREHCIPKSWWGGAKTNQGADAFIVVPTDGYVNSMRGNLPFGNVNSATYQSSGGFSKKGNGKSSYGYTSTVFEPDDSVKGDFARIYFYAIVAWDNSYSWNKDNQSLGQVCFKGTYDTTNHGLTDYAIKLLSEWSKLDPVSDWERSVNTKVKAAQGNVNPFIDHPEYADVIWKDATGYTKYVNDTGITSISKTSASLTVGETTTINAVSSNSGTISWVSDDEEVATVSSSTAASGANVTITAVGEGTATITASITISGTNYSATCPVTVTSSGGGGGGGSESSGSYTIRYDDTFSPALPSTSATVNTSSTSHTDETSSFTFKEQSIYKGSSNDYLMFVQDKGFIYNTSSLGTVDSVSITYSSGTSTSGKIGVYFGTAEQSSYTTTSNVTIKGQSKTDTFENSTSGKGFFQISTSNKNVQITTIEIAYHDSSTPTPADTYTLTYNKNTSDTVTGMPSDVSNIESGSTVTLTGTPSREGYTFSGWSLTSNGETISSIENVTENKTVYAIWQENAQPTPSSGAVNYYKLGSSDSVTTGRYIIAINNGSYYSMTRTLNSGNRYPFSTSAVTVEGNSKITSSNGSSYEFLIESVSGGITIKNPTTDKYVKYDSGTALAESTNSYTWTVSAGIRGTFRVSSQTAGRALAGRVSNAYVFGGYSTGNITAQGTEYYDIELFRGYTAEEFASEFNSNITCNAQGSSTPSFGSGYSWSTFESNYSNKLTSDQKTIIKGASYTKSGSGAQTEVNPGEGVPQNIANCVAKYDYIVGKYNPTLSSTSAWKDFIDRKPAPVTSGRITLDVLGLSSGNTTTIIIVISAIGVAALGGYVFIRKRKES